MSSFLVNINDISGGGLLEISNDDQLLLPEYEREVLTARHIASAEAAAAVAATTSGSLKEKLLRLSYKVDESTITKLLDVTDTLWTTQYMNNNKTKHQDTPNKEVIRVLVNDIAKNDRTLTNTVDSLRDILRTTNDSRSSSSSSNGQ